MELDNDFLRQYLRKTPNFAAFLVFFSVVQVLERFSKCSLVIVSLLTLIVVLKFSHK
jgi:hypothetical protein